MSKQTLTDKIDELLPQTQCGLCSYGGCRPYAQAIATENALINRCPPGGVKTLNALAALLQQDPSPYVDEVAAKSKAPSVAIIREEECIGCTKCIQACPVDAIIGASKVMHVILTDQCTGCELCIPPCPVDCIDLSEIAPLDDVEQQHKSEQWRRQYQKRNVRLSAETPQNTKTNIEAGLSINTRQSAIKEALERARTKTKGFSDESQKTV